MPNQTLQQTAALLRWLRGIPPFEGRPLLNLGIRPQRASEVVMRFPVNAHISLMSL